MIGKKEEVEITKTILTEVKNIVTTRKLNIQREKTLGFTWFGSQSTYIHG